MGQLMGIVGPILLLGGAIYVFSKRCELLGLCGDTAADSGVVPEASAVEDTSTPTDTTVDTTGSSSSSQCCKCQMQGDRVKCMRNNDGTWFNPPAGSGGSNDQSVELSLQECIKGCSSSGGSSSKINTKGAGAGAGVRTGATIPKKPRLQASGSASAGAGVGGSKKSSSSRSSSSKKSSGGKSSVGIGAGGHAGVSLYGYRSYFVDPYYVRPFTLYHRIAN